MKIEETTGRQIEIVMLQRAIERRAVALAAFRAGITVLERKQRQGFAELAKQMAAEDKFRRS